MLSLRWFPVQPEPVLDMFKRDHSAVRFAWVTLPLNGSPKHCAVGPEQWEKGGHHGTWCPDGKRISLNLSIDREGLRFVQVNRDGTNLHKTLHDVPGSGHPTVTPGARRILTGTYTHEPTAFGDGTTPPAGWTSGSGARRCWSGSTQSSPVPTACCASIRIRRGTIGGGA